MFEEGHEEGGGGSSLNHSLNSSYGSLGDKPDHKRRSISTDSGDEELLRAAQIGSIGTTRTSGRRRMRLLSRSFNQDTQEDGDDDTKMREKNEQNASSW